MMFWFCLVRINNRQYNDQTNHTRVSITDRTLGSWMLSRIVPQLIYKQHTYSLTYLPTQRWNVTSPPQTTEQILKWSNTLRVRGPSQRKLACWSHETGLDGVSPDVMWKPFEYPSDPGSMFLSRVLWPFYRTETYVSGIGAWDISV